MTFSCWLCLFEPASTRAAEVKEKGATTRPVSTLHLHGDVRFTPHQRALIESGIRHVNRTSCGFVNADVVWDMDNVAKYIVGGKDVIVATNTEELVKLKGPDAEYNLGLTVNLEAFKWIFLVMPKLDDDKRLEWVVAHEVTHAAGMMDHDTNGLMETEAPWLILPDEKPEWSGDDIKLFCKRWVCKPEMFDACRSR